VAALLGLGLGLGPSLALEDLHAPEEEDYGDEEAQVQQFPLVYKSYLPPHAQSLFLLLRDNYPWDRLAGARHNVQSTKAR
jgi:hypothetical protein